MKFESKDCRERVTFYYDYNNDMTPFRLLCSRSRVTIMLCKYPFPKPDGSCRRIMCATRRRSCETSPTARYSAQ